MAGAGFYHATFRDGASGCIHIGLGSDRRAPCLQTFGITEFINAKVLQERGALLTKKIERGRQLLESEKARTAALEASVSDCISAEEQYCEIRRCLSLVWKEASN
ncbi:uncharacterized protein LOC125552513 isoform X1 [Triticum urartu]|uniref:uncharacterized protein LOC125552513 isoform X1 n=1 Tax=Triticum urartu TaxID=4572 RepID=UPI0020440893|nr:uncharacterized protein LOC125552513 isoform X1 [Triticum urartu]XP_048572055.1 uncharacterized protein LOC125552513 isoform X1 [Triticum urartu]